MSTETWSKDVYELVDYDSHNLDTTQLIIKNNSFIYREDNKVVSSPEKNKNKNNLLFQINTYKGKEVNFEILSNPFILDENNIISPNSSWFVLKPSRIDIKMNRYKLNPEDIIKIGRITLRIRDIHFSNNKNNNSILNESNITNSNIKEMNNLKTEGDLANNTNMNNNKKDNKNNNSEKEKIKPIIMTKNSKKENNIFTKIEKKNNICRICYMEEEDDENPLLQPCICSGSMKFIHLSCLKHWISTRSCVKIDTTENCNVYIIKPVECELCKTKFPDLIKHQGKLYPLLDFSKEFENYLTLESLTVDKHKNKFIYVISLKKKKIKMGRGHESDVLLSDISVSRVHCFFIIDNKKVYLEDNNSKFASLILIQYSTIKLLEGIPLYFQVGRTYIDCKIKKNFKLFNCCNIEESTNLYYYYNLNEKQIQNHMNLIVKRDYNEIDTDSQNDNKINNTFAQKYPLNIDEKYNFNTIEKLENDNDKISDNAYFLMKRKKLNKNITKALIDDDIDNENDNKNNEEEEIIDDDNEDKNNKSENNNSVEGDNNLNKGEDNSSNNKSQNINENKNNQEEEESIRVSENDETLKKENYSTLE